MLDERDRIRGRLALGAAGLALLLVLAGCGDLSLLQALKGDSPGELRFSPSAVLIPEMTDFTFSVLGGFTPYEISLGAGVTRKGGTTWVFPGKDISAESELFTVEATDLLGQKATAEVTVYAVASPLELNVSKITLLLGQIWTFSATGGSGGFAWFVDGVEQAATGNSFEYTANAAGTYTVTVTDSVGVSRSAAVTVLLYDPAASLEISPPEVTVLVGGTAYFTALGGSGAYTFEVLPGGAGGIFSVANSNPAAYSAPATAGSDTIKLTDDAGGTASATVSVVPAGNPPVLSPESPTVSVIGDTIQFSASGGTGLGTYTFSTNKPGTGYIDPVTGSYVQLKEGHVVVTVRDQDGLTDNTLVKFVR
ncbi:MAG: hypothetical protein A2V99_03275 [Spirochaetes bacterium RBG_16_67_19]|nr:MAG: hypothetical protein A2V99_03275 [Spirochaetes bacterium RBG_16_67_19]